MREHNAQYLLVLDKNLQVVGVVTIAIFNRQPAEGAPLPKFALEADAFGDLECRDDAALDLLAGLSGVLAG